MMVPKVSPFSPLSAVKGISIIKDFSPNLSFQQRAGVAVSKYSPLLSSCSRVEQRHYQKLPYILPPTARRNSIIKVLPLVFPSVVAGAAIPKIFPLLSHCSHEKRHFKGLLPFVISSSIGKLISLLLIFFRPAERGNAIIKVFCTTFP